MEIRLMGRRFATIVIVGVNSDNERSSMNGKVIGLLAVFDQFISDDLSSILCKYNDLLFPSRPLVTISSSSLIIFVEREMLSCVRE